MVDSTSLAALRLDTAPGIDQHPASSSAATPPAPARHVHPHD
jgi:hypothetical protein